jgi:phage shock protein B
MEDILIPIAFALVGMLWITLHYVTRWKTSPTLTTGDEALLDELYQLARRLQDRVDTVERLVAADNPEFRPAQKLRELDRLLADQKGTSK